VSSQGAELEALLLEIVPDIGISEEEELEKEAFRAVIEGICRSTISEYEKQELANSSFDKSSVEVQCFGSMKSGFATKASDMDLALISPKSNPAPDSPDSAIPRLLEQKLLELGYGARLLTRTRVPIIKLCQKPTQKLHSLLTLERAKWESGFIADADDDHLDPQTPLMEEGKEKEVIVGDVVPVEDGIRESEELDFISKLAHMKQKEHQSLGDYYSVAKRILRKVGGRDITPGAEEISDGEGKILNKVCKAFILGLFDPFLVNRLRSYSSIQPLFDSSLPPLQRTLHGIWIQIDGERLALGWSDRSMLGVDEKLEAEAEEVVNAWRTLQNKSGPMTDSLLYNRQLITASARLKGNILLRLLFLEQIVHEDPVFYYGRAKKLMESLQSHQIVNADSLSDDSFHLNVINRYILGISNPKISKALSQLIGNKDSNNATLEEIGFHHRILQLASDYEHALQVGFYDENHQVDLGHIQSYIKLLRKLELRGKHASNEEEAQLVEKIKSLPDPTKISTSKARDRYQDHLEFPKSGVGIQCDINFSAQLAIHNTLLLRCYSQCDPRVRPMILFVKHWAKVRGINTPYRGTLSSYGYVLMVLHFLVNIASPFVLPNLQDIKKDPPPHLSPQDIEARSMCNGRDVRFWRNEMEIRDLAGRKMLNHNHDSSGLLLRGFFEYYAQTGPMSTVQSRGFDWGREVLSLRTQGGILTKQEKGWVGAKTVVETSTVVAPPTPSVVRQMEFNGEPQNSPSAELQEVQTPRLPVKTMEETKEVRHRYLFAIEDPFELDHNVARTVTHNGIVSIRDEFRRAWRIITGNKMRNVGSGLLDPISNDESKADFLNLLDLIHGPQRQASSSVPQTANIEQPMSS
jgi:terminal uridylyltransferase